MKNFKTLRNCTNSASMQLKQLKLYTWNFKELYKEYNYAKFTLETCKLCKFENLKL